MATHNINNTGGYMSRLPTTGITACRPQIGLHAFYASAYRYASVRSTLAEIIDAQGSLPVVDAPSNILCHHYSGQRRGMPLRGFCFSFARHPECLGRPTPGVLTTVQTFTS
ncbi:hypothetical protein [Pseudomonas sp. NUPR-001]|uniref:hypothetical protein n=1 Tax=Pseudomonas sp. NUPR-001 TaxID=3416058 RepID=UPI003F97B80E